MQTTYARSLSKMAKLESIKLKLNEVKETEYQVKVEKLRHQNLKKNINLLKDRINKKVPQSHWQVSDKEQVLEKRQVKKYGVQRTTFMMEQQIRDLSEENIENQIKIHNDREKIRTLQFHEDKLVEIGKNYGMDFEGEYNTEIS